MTRADIWLQARAIVEIEIIICIYAKTKRADSVINCAARELWLCSYWFLFLFLCHLCQSITPFCHTSLPYSTLLCPLPHTLYYTLFVVIILLHLLCHTHPITPNLPFSIFSSKLRPQQAAVPVLSQGGRVPDIPNPVSDHPVCRQSVHESQT